MPSKTYFHLPEEKKKRLLDACWYEFTHHSFAEVSINKIIQRAGISRGSFYQYFSDKGDAFSYLMEQNLSSVADLLYQKLSESHGNLFSALLLLYDHVAASLNTQCKSLRRCFDLIRRNPTLDPLQSLLASSALPPQFAVMMRSISPPNSDRGQCTVFMALSTTAYAISALLAAPERREELREFLKLCLTSLHCAHTQEDPEAASLFPAREIAH